MHSYTTKHERIYDYKIVKLTKFIFLQLLDTNDSSVNQFLTYVYEIFTLIKTKYSDDL